MGGKNKQRTKGNVRPSSSGRAAEVLTREGGVIPGFVGFDTAVTSELSYVPAVHGAEEIDNLVDADFRLVLRKLSKRDNVTRLKAVQDFGAMCQDRDAEDVKGVLPYWPRIYCKISMDYDRRIREATQIAFEQLVLKVRRNMAPFLKSLMGHWILSQCDTYSPAASAACRAFQAAFSPTKQPEAISFCKDEILNVLQDILLKETPNTLSDPQSVTEEEREAKYVRMLTSSLLGVKRLLSLLPQDERTALETKLADLLSSGKFWKYSKHKTPQVRGALFELICALCELTPAIAQAEAARLCPAVLLNIDDADPLVLAPVWEAVLHVVSSIPDCWTHVNAKKGFLPKLWALLKDGGKGMAKALHPNLMPLLSKLPEHITDPKMDFLITFFTSLINGLSSERAASSPSENAIIVTSAVECLRYCIVHNAQENEKQKEIRTMLLSQQLLPLLETAIRSPSLQNGPLFYVVTEMLVSWEKRAGLQSIIESNDNSDVFKELVVEFWKGLALLFVRYVDSEETDPEALEGMATLLQVMRCPDKMDRKQAQKKKSVKICFSSSDDDDKTMEGEDSEGYMKLGPAYVSEKAFEFLQTQYLEDVVCQLAQLCLVHVIEKNSERHLVFLSRLLQSFHTPRVFTILVELDQQEAEDHETETKNLMNKKNPAMHFLLERVVVWLAVKGRQDTEPLVEMVFSSVKCCSQQETTRILNHITMMNLPWGTTLQFIQKACSDSETLTRCNEWLKGSVLGETLLGLTKELCKVQPSPSSLSSADSHSWTLISLVLSQHHNNVPLIGEVYMEKILERLHSTLSKTKSLSDAGNMEPLISFVCDVALTFFSSVRDCLLLESAEELLLTVFKLTAQDQTHTHFPDSLAAKLQKVCEAGVQSLVHYSKLEIRQNGFFHSAVLWVKDQLLTVNLDNKSLQVLISAIQSLADAMVSVSTDDTPFLIQIFNLLTPTESEWTRIRQALPPQWVKLPLLSRQLRAVCEKPSVNIWKFRGLTRLPAHLCVCALLGKVAKNFNQSGQEYCFSLPTVQHTAAELLFALQWCKEVEYSPAMVSAYYSLLVDYGLSEGLNRMIPVKEMLQTLYSRSIQEGGLWSLALENYIQTQDIATNQSASLKKLYNTADCLFPLSGTKLNTLQVVCKHMSIEDRDTLVALATAGIISWQENRISDVSGCMAVLLCCLETQTPIEDEIVLNVLDILMQWRNSKEDWFLFHSEFSQVTTEGLNFTVEMMRFLSWVVTYLPSILKGSQWDFILCSMLAWLEAASDNVGHLWNPWVQLFVCENAALIVKLNQFFTSPPPDVFEKLPKELTNEWSDFFVEGLYNLLLPLPTKITDAFPEPEDAVFPLQVFQSIGVALTHVPIKQLTDNSLPARFIADQQTNLPENLQTLLNTLCPLLLFKARPLQITVYCLLDKVMPKLPECDGEGDNSKADDDKDEPSLSPPASLMAILSACEDLCENILTGVQVGEFAVVQPLSVEYSCILGYLLAWKLLLNFFRSAPSHLRAHYAQFLKQSSSLNKLLRHLFKLMPETPVVPGGAGADTKEAKTFFTESLSLAVDKSHSAEWELPHLACSVYYSTLQDLPAMVRLWWNSQEKRVSATVEKFTIKHISPVLSAQEISSVHSSTQMFDNMTVKARSAAREVIATYSVDDICIELVIQLPQNYPLGSITVESGKRVGVSVQQWRNWMLQLSTYLTHQNGSIMEGLALWKNNVDKRFEGIEDCMICFSVIHGSNYSLPKKACRTCKKKFHSACLYKWFTSSNKSTCPLCRETFF